MPLFRDRKEWLEAAQNEKPIQGETRDRLMIW
jgi:hypothetical protein